MESEQERIITIYIKAYLEARDRWVKRIIIVVGVWVLILTLLTSAMLYYFAEWNQYRLKAKELITKSEDALKQWRDETGIKDTTNGTR